MCKAEFLYFYGIVVDILEDGNHFCVVNVASCNVQADTVDMNMRFFPTVSSKYRNTERFYSRMLKLIKTTTGKGQP